MPIYTNRIVPAVTFEKTVPVAAEPTSPKTVPSAGIPTNVLQAWQNAAPALGSQLTANPAALATPNELGIKAARLPERNQELYMEQLIQATGLVAAATSRPWTPVDECLAFIRRAIDILQSLAANLPPDQQKALNQIISQLQVASSLEGAPLGDPNAWLDAARSALNELMGSDPGF